MKQKWASIIVGAALLAYGGCGPAGGPLILRQGLQYRFDGYYIAVSNADRQIVTLDGKQDRRRWVGGLWFNLHDRGKQVMRGDTFSLANVNFKVAGFLPGVKRNAIVLRRRPL
jgi:hypothetical protein